MNAKNKFSNYLLLMSLLALSVFGCKDDDNAPAIAVDLVSQEDASVPLEWMKLYLEIDRYLQDFRPGPTARALAYINLAAYESSMKGMLGFKSLSSLYSGLDLPAAEDKEYHYPTVVNAVYANLFKRFLPGGYIVSSQQSNLQFKILELEESNNEAFRSMEGPTVFDRSQAYGEAVATAVWDWAKTDPFGHDAHLLARPEGYSPPVGPGLWTPTPPQFSRALFPYWGNARTFAISESEKLAKEPFSFSEENTSQFYAQALEVRNTVSNLEFNDQWIAEFWNDENVSETFSPAAHWISIANQVVEEDGANLETALYAYTMVSLALNDAGIAASNSKYVYNVERPVTFINRVLDATWAPHQELTPDSPSYPSCHAVMGAAAAEVLSYVFGYNHPLTDNSHEGRTDFLGMPRSFDTFYQMADENASSRIKMGASFGMDVEEGLRLGYQIGRKVNQMPFK